MIIYMDGDSNEENSENEGEDQKLEKGPDVAIELKVDGERGHAKVNLTNILLAVVNYALKGSKPATLSGMKVIIINGK